MGGAMGPLLAHNRAEERLKLSTTFVKAVTAGLCAAQGINFGPLDQRSYIGDRSNIPYKVELKTPHSAAKDWNCVGKISLFFRLMRWNLVFLRFAVKEQATEEDDITEIASGSSTVDFGSEKIRSAKHTQHRKMSSLFLFLIWLLDLFVVYRLTFPFFYPPL
jgi:hypothetical protein